MPSAPCRGSRRDVCGGQIVITPAVRTFGREVVLRLLTEVRWDERLDPHCAPLQSRSEFGVLRGRGEENEVFWTVEGDHEAADRVLILMLDGEDDGSAWPR